MKLVEALEKCFDEYGTWYCFVAGSLVISTSHKVDEYQGGTVITFDFEDGSKNIFARAKGMETRQLNNEEKVLVAKLYIKHKNSGCAYWNTSQKIINDVEGKNE